MIFKYNKYIFNVKFKQKIVFNTLPSFIFRNSIGFQLKKIVCVLKNSECSTCILNTTCIYCLMFETPINKDNSFLEGRNRASHPYIIYSNAKAGEKADSLNLDVVLFGSGASYFPYILLAMMNAGKSGILRERVTFDINDVASQGRSIINKKDGSCENIVPLTWDLDESEYKNDKYENNPDNIRDIKINFLSPLRIKREGRYVSNVTYKDIIYVIARRIDILGNLFGSGTLNIDRDFIDSMAKDKKFKAELKWVDYERYSARQKQSMQMGGLVGSAYVSGSFSSLELSLLRAAELFNIGKNVSFGLGKVEVNANG